jgi:outer membrane protein OmpA-like peptidoglycan-associated protein
MDMEKRLFTLRVLFFLLIMVLAFSLGKAQDMLGIRNSNWAGLQGLTLNPSSMVDSRLKWDINMISAGLSFENDYLYIPRQRLQFFGLGNIVDRIDRKEYNDDFTGDDKNTYLSTAFMGPSVMFPINRKHMLALTSQARTEINLNGLRPEIAKYAFEGLGYDPLQFVNTFDLYDAGGSELNAMAWLEYGLSYAALIKENSKGALKGGLSVKLLNGVSAGYVRNIEGRFNVVNDQDMVFLPLSLDYGRVNYNTFDNINSYNDLITGMGFSFDAGITYEWRLDGSQTTINMDGRDIPDMEKNKYKFRLGLSVLDIGSILYDRNANTFRLQSDSALYPDWNVDEFQSNWDFDQSMSEIFYGNRQASLRDDKFRMRLPGSISVQGDLRLNDKFYLNATVIQALPNNSPGVDRASVYSITPRFETRWFEVAAPVSVMNYQSTSFRAGLALFLGSFWIGSDKLGSLLGLTDLYGMDLYAAFKYSIPWSNPRDRDMDHVSDRRDKCIDVPGIWKFEGCPDRDGDGIQDSRDTCPDIPGLEIFQGCPDRDNDSIPDRMDSCPDDPGLAEFFGCPDRDGDKIIDMRDSCPDLPGVPQFFGCPDRDGDGIIDPKDDCPDQAGLAIYQGCPDTDGDSIPDPKDKCPLVPGLARLEGCPEAIKVEAPVVKGPEKVELTIEEEKIIQTVFRNLQFETNKAVIKPESFPSLDALAGLLKDKPLYKLLIDGHTDNVGAAAYNLTLSKKRAKAAKDYLVNKGVDPSRITDNGYGLTKPVSTNATPEGRRQNRRVEFQVVK